MIKSSQKVANGNVSEDSFNSLDKESDAEIITKTSLKKGPTYKEKH